MKKYDIVIITYNSEKYLNRCLDSVICQPASDCNIIIIDDGSTDQSKNIIDKYMANCTNIFYYFKENTGVADTRNFALTKITSKYFMFLDADDYISPTLLDDIDKYVTSDIDIVSFSAYKVSDDLKIIDKRIKYTFEVTTGKEAILNYYLNRNNAYVDVPWGYIYNTKFFIDNEFKYEYGTEHEDTNMTPIIISKAKSFISTDILGYYYVQTLNSITRNSYTQNKRINDKIKHIRELYDYFANYGFSDEELTQLRRTIFFSLVHMITNLSKSNYNTYFDNIKRYKIYEIWPSKSKADKLVRLLYKICPFFVTVFFATYIFDSFETKDMHVYSFLKLIRINTYDKIYNSYVSIKSSYFQKIMHAGIFLKAYLRYLPALNSKKNYYDHINLNLSLDKENYIISTYHISQNLSKKNPKEGIINIFKKIDKCGNLNIIGYEKIKYDELKVIVDVLLKIRKIENILIHTDGEYIPKQEAIYKLFSSKKIRFEINKSSINPKNRERLMDKLELYNVNYKLLDK